MKRRSLFGPLERVLRLHAIVIRAQGMTRAAIPPQVPGARFFHRLHREGRLLRCLQSEMRDLQGAR